MRKAPSISVVRLERALVAALFTLLVPVLGRAQSESGAAREQAKALFDEGQQLYKNGLIGEACEKFEQSRRLVQTRAILINLARCHAAEGKTATAWREFQEVETLARAAGDVERARVAAELAAALEPKLARLRITVSTPVPGLVIQRNGKRIDAAELDRDVPLDPGRYRIRAQAPDYEAWEQSVELAPGGAPVAVTIVPRRATPNATRENALREVAPEPEVPPGGLAVGGFVLGGAGLVAVGVGVGLGVATLNAVKEAKEDDALCGPDLLCTEAGRRHVDAAEDKGIAATVLLGVGGAAVIAGIAMLAVSYSGDLSAAIAPFVGPQVAGIIVRRGF